MVEYITPQLKPYPINGAYEEKDDWVTRKIIKKALQCEKIHSHEGLFHCIKISLVVLNLKKNRTTAHILLI